MARSFIARRGDTLRLKAKFYVTTGGVTTLTDPASFGSPVGIYLDAIGGVPLTTIAPTKESTGVWYVDYTLPLDLPSTSVLYDEWAWYGTSGAPLATQRYLSNLNLLDGTSPIAWTVIEDALYDWLYGVTGLSVIWEEQDAPRPAYPYASLVVTSGPIPVGGLDEVRMSYDPLQPAGSEIGFRAVGLRAMTVSVRAHTKTYGQARDILSKAGASLSLPSVQESLRTASLSVIRVEPVVNASLAIEDSWLARAVMDVRFGLNSQIEERGTYIQTVEVDPNYSRPDGSPILDSALHATFLIEGP